MARVKTINDPSFPDWLKVEAANDNEIAHLAQQSLPIILPWGKQKVRLGTCYQSKLQSTQNSPFIEESPFVLSDLFMIDKTLQRENGTESEFKSVNTSRVVETGDHLSLGIGIGAGLPILVSVTVKGQFDQHVQENKDSNKISIRAKVKCGTLTLNRNPRLSTEAAATIKYDGGYQALCDKYGDYFVAGYRLGGETGLLISTSSFHKEKIDTYSITATVEVLFIECTKTWSKDFHTASAGRSFSLLGYDTLEGRNWDMKSSDDGIEAMQEQSQSIMLRSQCILERGLQILDRNELEDGQDISWQQCEELADSGLITDLILLPMSCIREVAYWSLEDNII